MADDKMNQCNAYFIAGYAYALAEKIVKSKEVGNQTFLTETERKEEINYVWESILKGIPDNGFRRADDDSRRVN